MTLSVHRTRRLPSARSGRHTRTEAAFLERERMLAVYTHVGSAEGRLDIHKNHYRRPKEMKTFLLTIALIVSLHAPALGATTLDAKSVNTAQWGDAKTKTRTLTPSIVKLQVLLDRANFSPGEIDGMPGENVDKAVAAYAASQNLQGLGDELWQKLTSGFDGDVIVEYTISESDNKGPFADKIPAKMEEMKDLPALAYTSPKERLAERFHMSPELLEALNSGKKFDKPGETISVANVSQEGLPPKVRRIEIDKTKQTLRAFNERNEVIAFFPVTAGSREKPAPDGVLTVTSISKDPTYRYNPEYNFKGVKAREAFTIKPGPNNPVGLIWIGLNREGYGIHGTPEPSKISKSESHGCIRLTNWDALKLGAAVKKGIKVEFFGDEGKKSRPRAGRRLS
jgi:lipoprotein-anchoring transpeptidase ErfK/SrfK